MKNSPNTNPSLNELAATIEEMNTRYDSLQPEEHRYYNELADQIKKNSANEKNETTTERSVEKCREVLKDRLSYPDETADNYGWPTVEQCQQTLKATLQAEYERLISVSDESTRTASRANTREQYDHYQFESERSQRKAEKIKEELDSF